MFVVMGCPDVANRFFWYCIKLTGIMQRTGKSYTISNFKYCIYIISLSFHHCHLPVTLPPLRGGVGGVLQWWGRDRTGSVFRPRGPQGAPPRGSPPPILTSAQPAAHGRGTGTWRWRTCCKWGGRGENAAHSGCDGGETLFVQPSTGCEPAMV